MLVLSRKSQEGIVINGNIKIKVLSVKGETVRLGFEAPDNVVINREEREKLENNTNWRNNLPKEEEGE